MPLNRVTEKVYDADGNFVGWRSLTTGRIIKPNPGEIIDGIAWSPRGASDTPGTGPAAEEFDLTEDEPEDDEDE